MNTILFLCRMHPKYISITDFDYELPAEKIALYPQKKRDESRLLIYNKRGISEDIFKNLAEHLLANSFFVFNDTKVLNARILFKKETGAQIEIFLLEPVEAGASMEEVFQRQRAVQWKCLIGKAGKWKEKFLTKRIQIREKQVELRARLVEKREDAYIAELSWDAPEITFSEVIEAAGTTPLPPYIKRKAESEDRDRYQSVFSKEEGSVAAPTASLHFTDEVFDSLKQKGIGHNFVTLHVGAGTFKPVKSKTMEEHAMHAEYIDVSVEFLHDLKFHLHDPIYCVGTTAVRTIESLYWMGAKIYKNPAVSLPDLFIKQWEVYDGGLPDISATEALQSLIIYLEAKSLRRLFIQTEIIIAPGYTFRFVKGILTNFHQPKSTLLLLVAAFLGDDWRKIYDYALTHDFRFLSYGDACLLQN